MPNTDIKRVRYSERQYLRTQEFQDEQDYLIQMRRRHLIAHHLWGIVSGLDFKQDDGTKEWSLQPGIAIDAYGREIIVSAPEPLDTMKVADILKSQPTSPAFLNIWLAYKIETTDRPAQGYEVCDAQDQFTRVRETFEIIYQDDPSGQDPNNSEKWPKSYEDLPDDPKVSPWPIYLGTLIWDKEDPNDSSQNIITSVVLAHPHGGKKIRLYIGVVAAEIEAPDDRLLIQGINWPKKDITVALKGSLNIDNSLNVDEKNINNGTKANPGITFGFNSGEGIASNRSSTNDNQFGLDFYTKSEARMSITQDGNVGIGIKKPTHKFHVLAKDAVGLFESTGDQAYLRFSTKEGIDNRVEIANRPGGRLSLWTAGLGAGDVLNITKDGKVGIGTVSPSTLLEISRLVTSGLGPILRLTGGGGGGAQVAMDLATYPPDGNAAPAGRIIATDDANYSAAIDFQTKEPGGMRNPLASRLTITSIGNVGIGTPNPSLKLDIQGDFGRLSGGPITLRLLGSEVGDNAAGILFLRSGGGIVAFDGNDKVGIGTSAPSSTLEVVGDITSDGNLFVKGIRTYLLGLDGDNQHWIMAGGTQEGVHNAIGLQFFGNNNNMFHTGPGWVKGFLIHHPLDPTSKNLIHSTLEGPEAAVFYRGEAQLSNGEATVVLPAYFEKLVRKEGRTILLTPKFESDYGQVSALAVSEVVDCAFTVRMIDKKNPSQKFYWEVKAVRADVEPLKAEVPKM